MLKLTPKKMKWRPKNDTCGVPGKGFIKAEAYSEEDEKNLMARAKRRGIDFSMFMLKAGFEPIVPQVPLFEDDEPAEEPKKADNSGLREEYKALFGRNPRSDWSDSIIEGKIAEKKAE